MPIRYPDFDWTPIRHAHDAFWKGDLDRPILCLTGQTADAPDLAHHGYIPAYSPAPIDQIVDITEQHLQHTWYAGDGYPSVFTNYGAGVAAVYMRLASGHYQPDGGVWFDPATDEDPENLTVTAHTDTDWFTHTDAFVRQCAERFGDKAQISIPDLGGMLDVLASYRTTERLLTDMIDRPDTIDRLVREALDAWWVYYDHFHAIIATRCPGSIAWACVWSPGRTYMFQSDFCYMISPAMFERFVLPELTDCCSRVDHAFYHLDGIGQLPHLDMMLGIDGLHGVQWIPGAGQKPAAQWPDVLNRILGAGKKMQIYSNDPDEIFQMVADTGGARNTIIGVRGVAEHEADEYVAAVLRASSRLLKNTPVG